MPDHRWLLLVICTFALSSCSSTEWVHRYKKQDEFESDYRRCDNQASERSNSQPITLSSYQQDILVDQCLGKEGWAKKIRR